MSSERRHFVDNALQETEAALANPFTVSYLGDEQIQGLRSILGNLVVANIKHGVWAFPKYNDDAVPVVVIKPGESIDLGDDFVSMPDRQQEVYRRELERWGASEPITELFLEGVLAYKASESAIRTPDKDTAAKTSSIVIANLLGRIQDFYNLENVPPRAIGRFMLRPFVILRTDRTAAPDLFCHELTHAEQRTSRPIRLFDSGHEVAMDCLRDELFAYHVGAGIRLGINQNNGADLDDPYLQAKAEHTRRLHNDGCKDPFKPSESLLARFKELGMGHNLHGMFDFDITMRGLKSQSQDQ